MNTHHDAVAGQGPLIRIAINLPAAALHQLRAQRQPLPPPVEVLALVDTGADVTVVDPDVVARLVLSGLLPGQMLYVNAPALGPPVPVFEYIVSLSLPVGVARPLRFGSLVVVERSIGALGYQALLGRDVLASCGFFYDGPGQRFTLAY